MLADELLQRGTVDHTPVYPREIVKRALELNATAIILVHNHPSGDPTPSRQDIDMTKRIGDALSPMNIALHDHIIVARGKHGPVTDLFRSFKSIFCHKGDELWQHNILKNSNAKRSVLH